MSNELVKVTEFDRAHLDLIKEMYFKGSTDEEFQMFVHVCKKTGLDPAMKQVYPVKRWDSKTKKEIMTVQTSIDGYRLIAERTGCYAPGREPTYVYKKDGKLLSATAYVKKFVAGSWHEVAATAFYDEYVQTTKEGAPTQFWQKMAHNQLAKCAESLALRRAFPGDMSGIYTQDEMQQAKMQDVSNEIEIRAVSDKEDEPDAHKIEEKCPTIDDLSSSLVGLGTECDISMLQAFVKLMAAKHSRTEEAIIKSALVNEDQLGRFNDSFLKSLEEKSK